MGILSTIGGRSYLEFNSRKQIESETKKIVSYLDLAQSKTLAGEPVCETYGGNYSVSTLTGASNVAMSLTPAGCSAQTTYTFPDGYSLPEGDFTVSYNPEGTGVTGDSCIILQHPRSDVCGKITIEPSGSLTDDVLPLDSCTCS